MTRYILWLIFAWVMWRLIRNIRIAIRRGKTPAPPPQPSQQQKRRPDGTFSNIQDAEFEDITPKSEEPL